MILDSLRVKAPFHSITRNVFVSASKTILLSYYLQVSIFEMVIDYFVSLKGGI